MHAAALRYLDAVARYGSIRRASLALNISASAINRQILQLEELLGVELFERRASGMDPTEFGDIVIEHARRTLHDFEAVKSEIAHARQRLFGTVRIATLDSLTVHLLPHAMIAFRKQHPEVNFSIETGDPSRIVRMIRNDAADIGLTFGPQTESGLAVRHRVPANLCAIMHRDHELAGRKSLSVFDCADADIIIQGDSGPISDVLGDEIVAVKRSARPIVTSDSIIASKATIVYGGCIGFFTRFGFLEELRAGTLVAIPLVEQGPASLSLAMVVASTRRVSRPVDAFIDFFADILEAEAAAAVA